ncbi:MAG: OadG family transporter subunit [Acidaminococcaceae bacterium]|nr:OadG family transporter subunit [Acidaminococcaceae bacterium]
MGPITTNPWLIALINMTIVFGVLIALGVLMTLIQVIDPTKKKVAKPVEAPKAAPATAAVAAPAQDNNEVIAVIAAAVAACGCSAEQIACIRRVHSTGWTTNARAEAISVRKECF